MTILLIIMAIWIALGLVGSLCDMIDTRKYYHTYEQTRRDLICVIAQSLMGIFGLLVSSSMLYESYRESTEDERKVKKHVRKIKRRARYRGLNEWLDRPIYRHTKK